MSSTNNNFDNQQILKMMQEKNLETMVEIARICEKHGLRYFLAAGTLLGGIRHGGTIPWDDDADIVMPRSDYNKFFEIIKDELGENFALVHPEKMALYFDMIPKIRNLTYAIEDSSDVAKCYEFAFNNPTVDIFVMDDISSIALFKVQCLMMKLVYGLAMGHRYSLNLRNYSGASKIFVGVFSKIGKLFKLRTIAKWYDSIAQWGTNKCAKSGKSTISSALSFSSHSDQIQKLGRVKYLRSWMADEYQMCKFDGKEFRIPKAYDDVLKTVYGDYMKLPPESERVARHIEDRYTFL